MSNVIPLHRCGLCGAAGSLRTLTVVDTDDTTDIISCDACHEAIGTVLARVRPVFVTMLRCGVTRETANEVMTILLDKMDHTQS